MFKTIRDGERVAVWDKQGKVDFVSGPKRLMAIGKTVQVLPRYAAGADEYLVVRFRDGHSQHLHGPATVWFHPVEHAEVRVEKAVSLDASEALVVYSQAGDKVARRVVRGPSLFMPAANEWLHEFKWHGNDPKFPHDPRKKIPRALVFQKVRVIPDQMYLDVEDVRTADDALLVIKTMVFFELVDVEKMLDQTHDPIADFINGLTADVIDFAGALTFDQFKEQTDRLNDLATYRQLVQRAERIGYRINKLVYRGYQAGTKLQAMHDGAIESRTRLRLESETEQQAQELADLKLRREAERSVQRRDMEAADLNHQNALKRLAHDEHVRQQAAELAKKLEAKRLTNEVELQHRQAVNRERVAYLQAMQGMEVDLTRYLVARHQNPDKLIRIDGNGKDKPQLHLHG